MTRGSADHIDLPCYTASTAGDSLPAPSPAGREHSRSATASRVPLRTVFVTTEERTTDMWVIVRQEDWVGGEDVLGAVGPFTTEADAQTQLALMQREIDQRAFKDERLWLMPMVPATIC